MSWKLMGIGSSSPELRHCLWRMGRWKHPTWFPMIHCLEDIDPGLVGVSGKELAPSSHDSSLKVWRLAFFSVKNAARGKTLVSVVMVLMFVSSSGPFSKANLRARRLACSREIHILLRYTTPSFLKVVQKQEGCEQVCRSIFDSSMATDRIPTVFRMKWPSR